MTAMPKQHQLRLVADDEGPNNDSGAEQRVFAHWVFMLGKNPRRTALGPDRRRLIRKWLALYEEDTLLLAVEGCAASAFHAGDNDRQTVYNDLELILRNHANIERFAEAGERLRQLLERARAQRAEQAADAGREAAQPAPSEQEAVAWREQLRTFADRAAGRSRG